MICVIAPGGSGTDASGGGVTVKACRQLALALNSNEEQVRFLNAGIQQVFFRLQNQIPMMILLRRSSSYLIMEVFMESVCFLPIKVINLSFVLLRRMLTITIRSIQGN
jgi:hypothetical protein